MKPAVLVPLIVLSGVAVSAGITFYEQTHGWVGMNDSSPAASPTSSSAAAQPGPTAAQPRPDIVVEETEYDFGSAPNHTNDLKHAFKVRNDGTAALSIESATASCTKCTFFDLPPDPIPPGGSAEVVVRWNIDMYEDSFRQSVTIHTNDPDRPHIRLGISGRIVQVIDVVPKELVFSRIVLDESSEAHVRLYANLNDDLQIVGQELEDKATSGFFEVKPTKIEVGDLPPNVRSGFDLMVSVKPGLPAGAFEQTILIKTSLSDAADVKIPVRGTVINGITLVGPNWDSERSTLLLGTVDRSRGTTRQMKLIIRGQFRNDLKFEKPVVDPEWLKVTVHDDQKTGGAQSAVVMMPMTIEVPADSPAISRMGGPQGPLATILLPTNQPQVGSVKLRVRFTVIDR